MNSSPNPPQPPPSQSSTSSTPRMAPTRNLTPLPSLDTISSFCLVPLYVYYQFELIPWFQLILGAGAGEEDDDGGDGSFFS
ncbi:hypothetical protein GOBAR_DD32975 [Gossypium barbadense]|nr:hypothetical protein GOBAR_DD32975 [Gossypium barbadense]